MLDNFISRPDTIDVLLYDTCRCVSTLSLGRDVYRASDYHQALDNALENGKWDEFLSAVEPLAKRRRELSAIWQSCFDGLLDLSQIDIWDGQERLERLAYDWNVDVKLDAYYSGVPVDYIIGE